MLKKVQCFVLSSNPSTEGKGERGKEGGRECGRKEGRQAGRLAGRQTIEVKIF
jgi:hypothetical protein